MSKIIVLSKFTAWRPDEVSAVLSWLKEGLIASLEESHLKHGHVQALELGETAEQTGRW